VVVLVRAKPLQQAPAAHDVVVVVVAIKHCVSSVNIHATCSRSSSLSRGKRRFQELCITYKSALVLACGQRLAVAAGAGSCGVQVAAGTARFSP
jgi:hypothetical protein